MDITFDFEIGDVGAGKDTALPTFFVSAVGTNGGGNHNNDKVTWNVTNSGTHSIGPFTLNATDLLNGNLIPPGLTVRVQHTFSTRGEDNVLYTQTIKRPMSAPVVIVVKP